MLFPFADLDEDVYAEVAQPEDDFDTDDEYDTDNEIDTAVEFDNDDEPDMDDGFDDECLPRNNRRPYDDP